MKQDIKILFKKFINNQCSASEIDLVFELLNDEKYDGVIQEVMAEEKFSESPLFQDDEIRYQRIHQKLHKDIKEKQVRQRKIITRNIYYKLAAVISGIIILASVVILLVNNSSMKEITTAYGETKMIMLPDSSIVTLNANTNFRYAANWKDSEERKVYLDGEAFFEVQKDVKKRKFLVHTNSLVVEVLGTRFNVSNRDNNTKVVLNSGQVKVNLNEVKAMNEIMMEPGDLVEYEDAEKTVTKRKVDAQTYTSWTNNELIFESTPVSEIIKTIENLHGVTVDIKRESVMDNQFTSTFPLDNYNLIIQALATTYDLNYESKGRKIIMY